MNAKLQKKMQDAKFFVQDHYDHIAIATGGIAASIITGILAAKATREGMRVERARFNEYDDGTYGPLEMLHKNGSVSRLMNHTSTEHHEQQ